MEAGDKPASPLAPLGRITGEDKVGGFGRLVAGEAGFVLRLVGRLAAGEVPEPPAAGCGVLFGVLDHDLYIDGRAGNESLDAAKHFVVFVGGDALPMRRDND